MSIHPAAIIDPAAEIDSEVKRGHGELLFGQRIVFLLAHFSVACGQFHTLLTKYK